MSWFTHPKTNSQSLPELVSSILYDERLFYHDFSQDLLKARQEVIIDSPFITLGRLKTLQPIFEKLVRNGVKVFVVTKHPNELEEIRKEYTEEAIRYFEVLGVQVLLSEGHHRKLAMVDRKVLWEGSLNILSQNQSREYMRRIDSKRLTEELFKFLHYDQVEYFRHKN